LSPNIEIAHALEPTYISPRAAQLYGDLESLIEETKEPFATELLFPSASSFRRVSHVPSRAAQLYKNLESFIMQKLNVAPIETIKIRKDFFTIISEKNGGKAPSLEESATTLKGIILAASKLGEAIKKEMLR